MKNLTCIKAERLLLQKARGFSSEQAFVHQYEKDMIGRAMKRGLLTEGQILSAIENAEHLAAEDHPASILPVVDSLARLGCLSSAQIEDLHGELLEVRFRAA